MHCVVDFVDRCTTIVLDFVIIEKLIGFVPGNYFGPSNGMEFECVRYLIERWKAGPGLSETVLRYVRHRDGKTAFSHSINMGQARIS
jgi:hypothetical protein